MTEVIDPLSHSTAYSYDGLHHRQVTTDNLGNKTTVLYDAAGHLLFHGGITPSRGHSGDNAGSQAIAALLTHHLADRQHTPVFGCDVFDATEQDRNPL